MDYPYKVAQNDNDKADHKRYWPGRSSVMIDLRSFSREALDYAFGTVEDEEEARELYLDIMEKVYEIEREDDKNGTNKLERLLERHNAAWIVEEYGLLD